MIFLTVGTQLSFDRMVEAVDTWCQSRDRNDVFGQIADPGPDGYQPAHFEWQKFLPPDQFQPRFEDAALIIAHAGMGSIISALTQCKPIIIMPRKADLGEHRNDHQLATAEKFKDRNNVYVAWEADDLPPLIDDILSGDHDTSDANAISPFADSTFTDVLKKFIHTGELGE